MTGPAWTRLRFRRRCDVSLRCRLAAPLRLSTVSTVLRTPPKASSAAARAVMQGNRSTDTRPEVRLRSALHQRGLRFRKHAAPEAGLHCRADVVFRREKVAVFLDGCFWHGCPDHGTRPATNRSYWDAKLDRNVERDRRNRAALTAAGWLVVEAWEHEPVDDVAERVHQLVLSRRGP